MIDHPNKRFVCRKCGKKCYSINNICRGCNKPGTRVGRLRAKRKK